VLQILNLKQENGAEFRGERALIPIHKQHGSLPAGHTVAPHAIVPAATTCYRNAKPAVKIGLRSYKSQFDSTHLPLPDRLPSFHSPT
jgi:hypothetical protein